ncbi:MAG: 4Fe-4S binding protein [Deltaproteobacteria bacterium]|jgi:NADH-quinone oxidoreductase subunit F|nr:4Fe-4S binding protein [Deltaproteobacteria bacterium]
MDRLKDPIELEALIGRLAEAPSPRGRLWVCGGPGCLAAGAGRIHAAIREAAEARGLGDGYRADLTGCLGLCEKGPLVGVEPGDYVVGGVTLEDCEGLVGETLLNGRPAGRRATGADGAIDQGHPFYEPQTRLITRRFGRIVPESLDDYLKTGGYSALALALGRLSPLEVSERVERSGLRGRGGGGFPAGRKWASCRLAEGAVKYVLANGDEGDPGAFMNRSLMEGDPFSIIEGMTLGAYAVGAAVGFVYVRHEYPLSVERLNGAIGSAERAGLLGENILGSGFSFRLETVLGGGAFVCGESTALMASIEGREGQPRVKYVRSTERGLWDSPTLLQNVETWANVPPIVGRGPGWFRSMGTGDNPGTKVFSLVGQVRRSGLVEMPLGTPIRSLVFGVGGGPRPGRGFKAVQIGGPSGGCLPSEALDLPLDFDNLAKAGAIMGSGGLIVMDDLSCMVDVARYFTGFLMGESCGKCTPCREGLTSLHGILDDLCRGRGRKGDPLELGKVASMLSKTALCGLGQSAANPLLSTLRHFGEEYREHAEEGFCRSGRCQGLFWPEINHELCVGCGACLAACPAGAISGEKKAPHEIDLAACVSCGACLPACRFGAARAVRKGARPERRRDS